MIDLLKNWGACKDTIEGRAHRRSPVSQVCGIPNPVNTGIEVCRIRLIHQFPSTNALPLDNPPQPEMLVVLLHWLRILIQEVVYPCPSKVAAYSNRLRGNYEAKGHKQDRYDYNLNSTAL
jgi:hypothetical protein